MEITLQKETLTFEDVTLNVPDKPFYFRIQQYYYAIIPVLYYIENFGNKKEMVNFSITSIDLDTYKINNYIIYSEDLITEKSELNTTQQKTVRYILNNDLLTQCTLKDFAVVYHSIRNYKSKELSLDNNYEAVFNTIFS